MEWMRLQQNKIIDMNMTLIYCDDDGLLLSYARGLYILLHGNGLVSQIFSGCVVD